MVFRFLTTFAIICLLSIAGLGQIDSLIGQLTDSTQESFAGGISADGRFIVFESRGNLATENPRNADGNREIFLLDYAQRRIFQITDTKSVLFDPSITTFSFPNVRVEIANVRPVISADGKWIAFSSNATSATPAVPNTTNPGSFDGNVLTTVTPTPTPSATPTPNPTATPTPSTATPTPTPSPSANPLTADANLEMWLYQVPPFAPVADLSAGDELPVTNLAGGAFIQVTNTDASQMPRPAAGLSGAFVADDNHDASISDDGSIIAFGSTRDLVPGIGNAYPAEDNDEIFTYVRATNTLSQVTKTGRGSIADPIYNKNPTISGNGTRVCFVSTGDNPIVGMSGGTNPSTSRNEEVFFSDLNAAGAPTGTRRQVTTTTPTNVGDPVNILELGRRMSKDGRFIAFDSFADLANENSGHNYTSFATYLYDATANSFRRILPRSDADTAAPGGDLSRYPGFTDNDGSGTPSTFVLETRMNIKADGTIPTTASDGLNSSEIRPAQIYSYPLNVPAATATFTRLAKFPDPPLFLASVQLLTTNSIRRMAFNLGQLELGTGNFDGQSEIYYFLKPVETTVTKRSGLTYYTGATKQVVTQATPSPTATPTATPTPSPTASPTPTPTPVTPATVYGLTNGMLAQVQFRQPRAITLRTASTMPARAPALPFELSGVTMTVNGVACGLKSVDQNHIEFVLPLANAVSNDGTSHVTVINTNGAAIRTSLKLVPARPDIFNTTMTPAPLGRSELFNVTNRVYTTEPFVVRTIKRQGDVLTASVLRLYLTGITPLGVSSATVTVRIRDQVIPLIGGTVTFVEPGVYTMDFSLPPGLQGAGDQPVVVTVVSGGSIFQSRLDDTTSRTNIL